MSVNEFMQSNMPKIQRIINELPRPFDSHRFIQVFTQQFQSAYSEMLNTYSDSDEPFKIVHQQIARFLSENQNTLGVVKQGKDKSLNIFGASNENEVWL
jgi:lipoate-protein ligase A